MEHYQYTGRGIGVALLDTGIYPHNDFRRRLWAFHDFLAHRRFSYDDNGHGTHVAGILAGDGSASMGKYRGAAPGCGIIALKVLDEWGNGKKEDVLGAFAWIMEYQKRYRIRVVNISVGSTKGGDKENAELLAGVERLWDAGLVIVAAAGNRGPSMGSITAPGSSRKIITVGCSDMISGITPVSGRGPTEECVQKPDIVAPGNRIVSCIPGAKPAYGVKSGTSMATPLISGAIACALEKNPRLTNRDIKMMIRESGDDMGFSGNIQGWGRFNRERFLNL